MKRLIPFDSRISRDPRRSTDASSSRTDVSGQEDDAGDTSSIPEPSGRQCALPVEPDPRRVAMYAIVTGGNDGVLIVREAPIEMVPFRDTDLVHFSYSAAKGTGEDIPVRVTDGTCFDIEQPFALPDPGSPIIIVGIDLGVVIDAEIIAGMESEARYRSVVHRHQDRRGWYNSPPDQTRSGGR